ncbi:MAG: serine/threonine protein kinase [Planctomycetes bacterium]|nr:serine/threonine protein kinase [Planctomycetota bacterium]
MIDGGPTPLMGDKDCSAARELSLRGARPPAKVPGYEQEQFLGSGAYGEVWVAVNRNSGRKVAIKFYTRRGGLDWASLAREVEKLRYLFSDRYVVQLFEVGWESDPPYYVMEFMENGSLEDLLRTGPISTHDAIGDFREVAIALVHAHNKGILHCDLKPANILLDHDRRPRLADFGQSRLTNEMSPALGTLYYMAPEQADLDATPDARWDVYALGAVMYRMLTGQPPHYKSWPLSSGNLESQLAAYRKLILTSPIPKLHRQVPGVNADLANIVERCLEPSPSKRFANPQAVVSALDAWQLRRVRRPILIFTGIGFSLLLLIVAAIGTYVFRTSVATARNGVIDRSLEGNRFAARTEARQLGMQIQFRWAQLEGAGRDPQIRELISKGEKLKTDPKACAELDAALAARRVRADRQYDELNRSSLWFIDDAGGYQRGTAPTYEADRHKYRGYRDYFHGLGRELEDKVGPAKKIIDAPHRSLVFRRQHESGNAVWSVAFSVPVWDNPTDPFAEQIGVVGVTLDLKGKTRVSGDRERFAVLIDTRADITGRRGLIIRHPYMEDLPPGTEVTPFYADEVVKWADEKKSDFAPEEDYHDPVGGKFDGGAWLASVERVIVRPEEGKPTDTGWVILVQERKDEVLAPVTALQWHLGRGGAIASGFLLLVITLVWMGTVSVLDSSPKSRMTRLLRRWAGLPTTTAGGTATANTAGLSANPSGQTIRPVEAKPSGSATIVPEPSARKPGTDEFDDPQPD